MPTRDDRAAESRLYRIAAEQAGAERYERRQREMRRGLGPRPMEYDEQGFPLRQSRESFMSRVARIIAPS